MASLSHNQQTASTFLETLVRRYQAASVTERHRLADTLLEELFKTPIADIELPTYRISDFWEHLDQDQPA